MATANLPGEAGLRVPPAEPTQAQLWLRSLRAPFLIASIIPASLGIVLAFQETGSFDAGLALLTLVGVASFQLATNMLNDNFDFRSGNDQAVEHQNPFAGGGRVLTTGRISLKAHMALALGFLALGTLLGLLIFFAIGGLSTESGRTLLFIGLLGSGAAVFYVGPPLKLAYRGLGEVVVGTCFGPLVVMGAYVTQVGRVSNSATILSVAMGLLIAAILWINEFPDLKADLSVGKRTAMARAGPQRSLRVYEAMLAGAFACLPIAVVFASAPPSALIALLAAPLAAKVAKAARANYGDPHALIPANGGTILLAVVFGALVIGGVGLATLLG